VAEKLSTCFSFSLPPSANCCFANSSSSVVGNVQQPTTNQYQTAVEDTLNLYCELFEELESVVASDNFDVNLEDGVLTVNLDPTGIYVLNKQTPNQQLWLSSPLR
jgi:frataxin